MKTYAFLHHIGEEHQEERQYQETDMHSVHIGICRYYHLVVSGTFDAVFDVERGLQKVELLVPVDYFLLLAERVERLSAQREDGLRLSVAHFGYGS